MAEKHPLTVFMVGDIEELDVRGVVLRGEPQAIRHAGQFVGEPICICSLNALTSHDTLASIMAEWLDAEDTWDGDFADDDRIARAKNAARAALAALSTQTPETEP